MWTAISLALAATSALAVKVEPVYNFTSGTVDIENSELRPNGNILLTTFDQGRLYTLDPSQKRPQAEVLATFPGATALAGISAIAHDKYAVVGGVRGSYHYDNETVYTLDLSQDAHNPAISAVARIPDAVMLNGLAALPKQPHVVLIGDARLGQIFRVDTSTGAYKVAFKDPTMLAPANATVPIGVNGLKVVGDWVYFTNSAQNIFAKVPVSDDGESFGRVRVVSRLNSSTSDWDDFVVDSQGVAYLAQPTNAIARIMPDGTHSVYAGGEGSELIRGPTSIQIAGDGWAYVTGSGGLVSKFLLPVGEY